MTTQVIEKSWIPVSGSAAIITGLRVVARWALAFAGALVLFGVLLAAKGANPAHAYSSMIQLAFGEQVSIDQIVIQMAPLVLGALAVAVPARAGLTNVGGEGQIIIGGIAACGASLWLPSLPSTVMLVAMFVAALIAGALWAGIAAALRLLAGVNEAISTLLLNFVALNLLLFLIYKPWKDPASAQAQSKPLAVDAQLPLLSASSAINIGIVIALLATGVVAVVLARTRWGFQVSVAGGNSEAARRAGLNVPRLVLSALMAGGALAGIAGMVVYAGTEDMLNPAFASHVGYTAFLVCWLARQRPVPILAAAFLMATLSVSASSLGIDSNVSSSAIYVLTALILMAVLGFTTPRKAKL